MLSAPRDMISMVSFVWARMFGGVDIVAEARDFARRVRQKSRSRPGDRGKDHHWANRWQLTVACRIDDVTEVAASFENRGAFFGDGSVSLKINALDPTSKEIGLTMAYSEGDLDVRADRLTLTDTAEARLVVKF